MASSRTDPTADPVQTVLEAVAGVLTRAGVRPADRLLVGFSGGLDSTVLLHALARLRGRFSFVLCAHHVHHGLSANADAWAMHCVSACEGLDVPCTVTRVALGNEGQGIEAAARAARHRAWGASDAQWWVTAHHQGDQAETVLFRLLRGAGVDGAAGMAPIVPPADGAGRLRPLLALSRAVLHDAATAAGLTWVEDESNADTRFSRNFLRHDVLPVLRERFPGADAALGRAAVHFADAADMLRDLARLDVDQCGERPIDRARFVSLSVPRQANMIRYLMRRLDSPMPDDATLGEALRQMAHAHADKALCLPLGAVVVHVYRQSMWLTPPLPAVPKHPLNWMFETPLPWGEGRLEARFAVGEGIDEAVFAHGAATVRIRWPGCGMRLKNRPLKAFKALAQESGLSPVERDRLPVLCVDDVPVWIADVGVAHDACCPPGGRGVVFAWVRPAVFCAGPK